MPRIIDLTGQRFGRLVVMSRVLNEGIPRSHWRCRCDCGETRIVSTSILKKDGRVTPLSCGCVPAANIGDRLRRHGMSYEPVYRIWGSMRARCQDVNHLQYPSYGGRGITVCERWQTFEHFYADMGDRPDGMSLDRIDNDGPYSPENCRWATLIQQQRNTRRNRFLTLNGRTHCIAKWADLTGITYHTIITRLDRGWSVHDVLTRPVRKHTHVNH